MADLRIAAKPEVAVTTDTVTLVANLTEEPNPTWREHFLAGLDTPPEVAVSVEGASIRLSWPVNVVNDDPGVLLDGINHAIEIANRPSDAATAAAKAWWAANQASTTETPTPDPPPDANDAPTDQRSETSDTSQVVPAGRAGGAILGWSLALGITSIFLGGLFGILPIVTVVVSVIALYTHRRTKHPKIWKAWVGLVLGILYTASYLYNYGYIG